MCGIAGIVDLRHGRPIDRTILEKMAWAIEHRGPDEEGFLVEPGLGLASRRLSIVGLADGQQPIFNEDRSIVVVFNGELFNHLEEREFLKARGHQFRTHCDTEILVHLWEEFGEEMMPRLRGQYGFALYDYSRRTLILARDRIGICPLHYARVGDWLYFGSEIKAILASGEVDRSPDPLGLDHIFTFFAMPGRRTAFEGISAVYPGSYLRLRFGRPGELADISEHRYWDLDFPDQGEEYNPTDSRILQEFRDVFFRAVDLRLRADVPVVSYLSGGIDSSAVLAAASQIRGTPIPSFTIKIDSPKLDETTAAMRNAAAIGARPTVVTAGPSNIAETYPHLITASDCPVVDTSCAALYQLAKEVHRQGYKVALTGEGSDEALAGYPWFKVHKLMTMFDVGGVPVSGLIRRGLLACMAPNASMDEWRKIDRVTGGMRAQNNMYGLFSATRRRFYRPETVDRLAGRVSYEDLDLNHERMKRWHPLNQSLYIGYKTILPGLLMNHKGDRVAMANSVETRYPFLDEEFVAFCSKIHPRWKLNGIMGDKHILRTMAAGFLPRETVRRPKAMFRAPFGDTFIRNPPRYVHDLLSEESLRRTEHFNPQEVRRAIDRCQHPGWWSTGRLFVEMALTGVVATQLWHHLYLGGGLCELPTWSPRTASSLQAIHA